LAVRKINCIGPKAEVKLHLMTIGDIAAQPCERLIDNFGKAYGAWMHSTAWGHDDSPVVTESEPVP
jgi:DNA polymerase IV